MVCEANPSQAAGLQRFLSRDPEQADYNPYQYCLDSPVDMVDPYGDIPLKKDIKRCNKLEKSIANLKREIERQEENFIIDKKKLPYQCPGDDKNPRLSVRGHQNLVNEYRRRLRAAEDEYERKQCDPNKPYRPPVPVPVPRPIPNPQPGPTPGPTPRMPVPTDRIPSREPYRPPTIPPYSPPPLSTPPPSNDWHYFVVGAAAVGATVYWTISIGTRVYPPTAPIRNTVFGAIP